MRSEPYPFVLILLVSLFSLIGSSIQQTNGETAGTTTCYTFTGTAFPNNTQCTGSRVCCAFQSECLPDRFCSNAAGQTIVPACSVFPWDDTCSRICLYDPGTGFLPRVDNCTDGSFCCDNDPTCCAEGRGIVLNGIGGVVSTETGFTSTTSSSSSSTTSSTTTTTSSRTTTSASSTVPATATATTATAPSSANLSPGAEAGIGIGAAAVAIGLVALIFWGYTYRRSHQRRESGISPVQERSRSTFPYFGNSRHELDSAEPPPVVTMPQQHNGPSEYSSKGSEVAGDTTGSQGSSPHTSRTYQNLSPQPRYELPASRNSLRG